MIWLADFVEIFNVISQLKDPIDPIRKYVLKYLSLFDNLYAEL